MHESFPFYSPDGKQVAYLAGSGYLSRGRQVAIRSNEGKKKQLLAPSEDGSWLSSLLGWSEKGDSVLIFEPKGTKYHLMFLPSDGSAPSSMTFNDFLDRPSLSPDRSAITFTLQNLTTPSEAYVSKLIGFDPIQISSINDSIANLPLPYTEKISWLSTDGQKIEGMLTYPLDYQTGKKYPLIVEIHGGPLGFFNEKFIGNPSIYPYTTFAEAGFMVLKPNPRGSCGYGMPFLEAIIEDFGGGDYSDILTGVQTVIELGAVDQERMGVMGWSYGGYMTLWILGQTNLFKAAASGGGYCNLTSFSGTTDSLHFLEDYLLGNFLTKESLFRERSPLYYVPHVTTPCLLQHGLLDIRVPPSQSCEYYNALKTYSKKASLDLYPTMRHFPETLETTIEVMKANFDWFNKHLH